MWVGKCWLVELGWVGLVGWFVKLVSKRFTLTTTYIIYTKEQECIGMCMSDTVCCSSTSN